MTHEPRQLTTFQFRRSLIMKLKLRAAWLRLVASRRSPGIETRPFILTGPPRSGTSLLTALLARKQNVIVANEPLVVSDPLLALGNPARLLRGYINGVARQAAQQGTFTTKVDPDAPNSPTTDTWNIGATRQDVQVNIDRTLPLAVGVKHPMSFMEYLDELLSGWSELRAIIIARQPGPTLRSWRETGYGWQPAVDDPSLGPHRRIYELIPSCETPLERRAHLWRVLMERAAEQAEKRPTQIAFIRYEELVARPAEVMERLYRHIGAANAAAPIDVSDVRPQNRDAYRGFDESEAAMIGRICGEIDRQTAWAENGVTTISR